MLLFLRQDKILYILDTTILIFYWKLYLNIVSIIALNIEARQYNTKINLAICADLVSKKIEIDVLAISETYVFTFSYFLFYWFITLKNVASFNYLKSTMQQHNSRHTRTQNLLKYQKRPTPISSLFIH